MKSVIVLCLLISSSFSFAADKACKDSVADWLNPALSVEKKSSIIKDFCSSFKGNPKAIRACLNSAYTWNSSSDVNHKYKIAQLTCSEVTRPLFGGEDRLSRLVRACLQEQWDKHSYIFDEDERRVNAASICSYLI